MKSEIKMLKIKEAIKLLMKQKKMTYADLAKELSCSEPTVKRFLGSEELTLSRVLDICEILEIEIGQLITLSQKNDNENSVEFNQEQIDFLVKNPSYLPYLALIYSGESPDKIENKYQLNRLSTEKYLLNLEKIGLIKVSARSKVKPAYSQLPNLGNSKLAVLYYKKIIQNSATYFEKYISEQLTKNSNQNSNRNPVDKDHGFFSSMNLNITRESYLEWHKEYTEFMQKLHHIAEFERRTIPIEQLKTVVLSVGASLVSNDYLHLHIIENALGDIVNLNK